MTESPTAAVTTSITVDAPIDVAFSVFTEDMASWWPPDHHILQAPLASMVFEPRAGGRVYDVGEDGTECQWARVLVHEPPHRVVFSWDISLQWQVESDPDRTSEVEVTLHSGGPEPHAGRIGAPAPGPPRRGLGGHARSGGLTRGLGYSACSASPDMSSTPDAPIGDACAHRHEGVTVQPNPPLGM